jgi:hypothetical protein
MVAQSFTWSMSWEAGSDRARRHQRHRGGSLFFVFGGEGPDGVFDEMEMYVSGQNKWYQLEPLPVAVHGVTGSAYVNGFIHLTGGGTSTGGTSGSGLHQVFWIGGICP